jgi:hypothetical protein
MNETKLVEMYINEAGNVQCRLAVHKLNALQAGDISTYCQMLSGMMLSEVLRQTNPFQPFPATEEKMPWD